MQRLRPFGLAFFLLFGAVTVCAQDQFSVSGIVENELTGAPVPRALVEIVGWPRSGKTSSRISRETFSDAAGTFRFDALPQATFTVSVRKPNYDSRGSVQVELGPAKENLRVKLTPLSTVSGTVTDALGSPMQGVQIRAYSTSVREGRRQLNQLRSVVTDDRGYYRLWNLSAGKLYLKAVGRSGGTALLMTERLPTFSSRESFAPVYLGGASRWESANPLEIAAGQETRVDFRLPLEPAYKIRGVVRNLQPYKPAKFELFSGIEDVAANRAFLNAVSGRFEVQDVVPGEYRLRVTQGDRGEEVVAETIVQVSNADPAPVELNAFGAVSLPVRVTITGEATQHSRLERELRGHGAGACLVTLLQTGAIFNPVGGTPDGDAGDFLIKGLLPGEYDFQVECPGAYVTSLMLGGNDILASHRITIAPGTAPPPLFIHAARNGGNVAVEVAEAFVKAGRPVLIAPMVSSAEGPKLVYLYRDLVVRGLAPGEYTVYLLSTGDIPYRDPQALQKLVNGVTVRVSAGDTAHVKLKDLAQ